MTYPQSQPHRHTPETITEAFLAMPRSRKGLDRNAVAELLRELATQVHEDAAAIARLIDQNARLKEALSHWQTEQASRVDPNKVDVQPPQPRPEYLTAEYPQVDPQVVRPYYRESPVNAGHNHQPRHHYDGETGSYQRRNW